MGTKPINARAEPPGIRTVPLSTRATPDEAREVEEAAAAVGHGVSGFLRWSALRTAAQIRSGMRVG